MNSKETVEISDLITDFLSGDECNAKELLCWFLNRVMKEEAKKQAESLEIDFGSKIAGYRNGYKPRTLKTKNGELVLNKPQFRYHPFETKVFERYSRVDKALGNIIRESYVCGVSTKKIQNVIRELDINDMSKSTISRIAGELDEEIREFLSRPIELEVPYVFLDATYFKVRNGGRYINKAVFIAYGINSEGIREILGIKIAHSESEEFWNTFFDELIDRGLSGVKLVVSDGHKGIQAAVEKRFLGSSWQMCIVHLKRAVCGKVPKKMLPQVKEILRLINVGEAGLKKSIEMLDELGLVDAADVLRKYQTAACNYSTFPQSHRRKLCSTNGVERINAEIKRRIKKVGAFPSDESAMRLIAAIVMDVDEDWMSGKIYLDMNAVV